MKKGDLVYVDYAGERKYLLVMGSFFSSCTGKTRYMLIDPKTGKADYLWEYQIALVHAS